MASNEDKVDKSDLTPSAEEPPHLVTRSCEDEPPSVPVMYPIAGLPHRNGDDESNQPASSSSTSLRVSTPQSSPLIVGNYPVLQKGLRREHKDTKHGQPKDDVIVSTRRKSLAYMQEKSSLFSGTFTASSDGSSMSPGAVRMDSPAPVIAVDSLHSWQTGSSGNRGLGTESRYNPLGYSSSTNYSSARADISLPAELVGSRTDLVEATPVPSANPIVAEPINPSSERPGISRGHPLSPEGIPLSAKSPEHLEMIRHKRQLCMVVVVAMLVFTSVTIAVPMFLFYDGNDNPDLRGSSPLQAGSFNDVTQDPVSTSASTNLTIWPTGDSDHGGAPNIAATVPSAAPETGGAESENAVSFDAPTTGQPSPPPSELPSYISPVTLATLVPTEPQSHPLAQYPSVLPASPTSQDQLYYNKPSFTPSSLPSSQESVAPSIAPSKRKTNFPSLSPNWSSAPPTSLPSPIPSLHQSPVPTAVPSSPILLMRSPSAYPTRVPTRLVTAHPSSQPTGQPSNNPTAKPTRKPSMHPTVPPSLPPSSPPSDIPTAYPSGSPSEGPTLMPSTSPTVGIVVPNLSLATVEAILYSPDSPQHKANEWLSLDPSLSMLRGWQQRQKFALATFYFAFNGEHWGVNNTWLQYGDECSWSIQRSAIVHPTDACENGQYRTLNVSYLDQFQGGMPDEISFLSQLERIHLSNNGFSGSVRDVTSPSLLTLASLSEIDIHSNMITGSIPAEMFRMTSLRELRLGDNMLTMSLPSEVGLLESLHVLEIQNNSLTGTLPTEILFLTQLITLDLRNNFMIGSIPLFIGFMTSLNHLDLSFNELTGELPVELSLLTDLKVISLNQNFIVGSIPSNLQALIQLQEMDLSNNVLTGRIPSNLVAGVTSLRVLDLHANRLTGPVPLELSLLTSLEYLDLSSTSLEGEVPGALCDFQSLSFVKVNCSRIDCPCEVCVCA